MRLDPATLMTASCATTTLVGALFLLSWRQSPASRALCLWGAAHLAGALGSGGFALRGQIPDALSIGAANAVMLAAYGLIWSGARAFEGLPQRSGTALSAACAWGMLCLVPVFYESITARIIFASAAAGLFCTASAATLWRGRAEHLASRLAAVLMLAAHGLFYLVRIPATLVAPPPPGVNPLASPWVTILCFVAMLFSLAGAFTFMALVKERAEREQRMAARTDALTGVANRRAFVEAARAALSGRGRVALVLFDLDRFKAVNDTYGHAVGDGVLVGFCAVAEGLLPHDALLGRLGGEEFACLLPDASPAAARACAERLRRAFGGIVIAELPSLRLSLSAGIAHAAHGRDLDALMRRADEALYTAKANGRDRVETDPGARQAA